MGNVPSRTQDERVYPINLHLPGILRLLSEHLYSDPKVVLREMIQNAHDSCQRRALEDPAATTYVPRIDIRTVPKKKLLVIQDNGSGLTPEEIHGYLATIGRSYTAELQQRLEFGGHSEALELIGQFGLGLLSAFVAADRLVMVTRHFRPGSSAWRWSSEGGGTYTLAPTERSEPGSTFYLHLKLAGEFLLNEDVVRGAIRTYADFLRTPVYLNDDSCPINVVSAPWHYQGSVSDYKRYIVKRFGVHEPLAIVPLHDHVEEVMLPNGATDEIVIPLRGVLFVPMGSIVSVNEYGDVAVYVRRMYITDDERDLLPRWAKFVRGVVECPLLRPTASREQVQRDETFFCVQKIVEEQLLTYLKRLPEYEPGAWHSIVAAHNDLIKGWALESQAFFEAVCDVVTFDTSRGRLTLREYLEASGGNIYYFVEERGATQEKMLYEASGLTVIDASHFAEEAFLKAYVRAHPDIVLHQLEPGAGFVFSDVAGSDRWGMVVRYYNEQGIRTKLVSFSPDSIPAVFIYPAGSDHISGARASLRRGEISGPLAKLFKDYLRAHDPIGIGAQGTLHLNVANSLMRYLCTLSPGNASFTAALEIVYHNARFLAGRALTPEEARLGSEMIGYSVEQLIKEAAEGGGRSGSASSPVDGQDMPSSD